MMGASRPSFGWRKGKIRAERIHRYWIRPGRRDGSVFPNRDVVPEERVAGGSEGLGLLGRKRSQEALEFLVEESGWGSALGLLPEWLQVSDISPRPPDCPFMEVDRNLGATLHCSGVSSAL